MNYRNNVNNSSLSRPFSVEFVCSLGNAVFWFVGVNEAVSLAET